MRNKLPIDKILAVVCANDLIYLYTFQSVDMDQSDGGMMNEENQSMFFGASSNVDFVGGQNNPEQNYSNKVFAQNVRIEFFK